MIEEYFYTVYQTTNNVNGKIYTGRHITQNLNDSYMGSGKAFKNAVKIYGIHNFSKEILFIFDNKQDMLNKEAEIVTKDFVKRKDTYNLEPGGKSQPHKTVKNSLTVKDSEGNNYRVSYEDPRYLNGTLIPVAKGLKFPRTYICRIHDHKEMDVGNFVYWCKRTDLNIPVKGPPTKIVLQFDKQVNLIKIFSSLFL